MPLVLWALSLVVPLVPWACRWHNYRGPFFSAFQRGPLGSASQAFLPAFSHAGVHRREGWEAGVGEEGLMEERLPTPTLAAQLAARSRHWGRLHRKVQWECRALAMESSTWLGMFLGAKAAGRGRQPRWEWVGFGSMVGECGWQSV